MATYMIPYIRTRYFGEAPLIDQFWEGLCYNRTSFLEEQWSPFVACPQHSLLLLPADAPRTGPHTNVAKTAPRNGTLP